MERFLVVVFFFVCKVQSRLVALVRLLMYCSHTSCCPWGPTAFFLMPHCVLINIDGRNHQAPTLLVSPGRWSPHLSVRTRDSITANQKSQRTTPTVTRRACLASSFAGREGFDGEKWEIKLCQMLNYSHNREESRRRLPPRPAWIGNSESRLDLRCQSWFPSFCSRRRSRSVRI